MTLDLILPGATPTGLQLPGGLSYDEWRNVGTALGRMDRAMQWWVGDWLLYGEHVHGEKYVQAAAETGLSEETLKQCQWVASRFTQVTSRHDNLSWSHHRAVAGMDAREAQFFLAEAEREGWSATELGRQLKANSVGVHFSSESDQWETPQPLFDLLNAEFGFEMDVCADEKNAKCQQYFSEEDDGLTQEWAGVCWMNPPYGDEIADWVEKAYLSARVGATKVVCLLPARVDTGWWWDYCRYGEIRFLPGRLKFSNAENGAPFPSAIVVFPSGPVVKWWNWREELWRISPDTEEAA